MLATTTHGYEGSGRVFERILVHELPRPMRTASLATPIRYPPGDPLERWVYEAFLLKAEPPEPPSLGETAYSRLDPARLAEEPGLLEQVAGILVQAHYRNTPDDLLAMLDAPHHELHVLWSSGVPVAVAETGREEPGAEEASRIALERLALYAEGAAGLLATRVIRIAVAPRLQRRGLGSLLLGEVERRAAEAGSDLVTTIFSRHDVLGFWLRNGYTPYYVSPRYNRVTGEKNVALAKALTPRGREVLGEAARAFKLRLLLSAHSVYRDLAAEKIQELLRALPPVEWEAGLTAEQHRRLSMYLEGQLGYEQAHDAVYVSTISCLAVLEGLPLDEQQATLVAARVLQGKTLDEASRIAGVDRGEAEEALARALRRLLEACGRRGAGPKAA